MTPNDIHDNQRPPVCPFLWMSDPQKAFSFREGAPPLTRGSAPGPRWGLRPQTPLYARAPRLPWSGPLTFLYKFTPMTVIPPGRQVRGGEVYLVKSSSWNCVTVMSLTPPPSSVSGGVISTGERPATTTTITTRQP